MKAEADRAAEEAADAPYLAVIELFSDSKTHDHHRRFYYDPDRQEFVQDELDFALEEAIKGGKPRRPR